MDANENSIGQIYTCDILNDFAMDTTRFQTKFNAMPRTTSTDALNQLVRDKQNVDLFHIDGKFQKNDPSIMAKLSHADTIIALDDFIIDTQVRKGVHNVAALKGTKPFGAYFLVLPAEESLTQSVGISGISKTALLLPPTLSSSLSRN